MKAQSAILPAPAPDLRREMTDLDSFAEGSGLPGQEESVALDQAAEFKNSQIFLLLAFDLEEQLIELSRLRSGYNNFLERFKDSLGPTGEEVGEESIGTGLDIDDLARSAPVFPWAKAVAHMLRLLPQPLVLFTRQAELVKRWKDEGIRFVKAAEASLAELLPDTLMACKTLEAARTTVGVLLDREAGDLAGRECLLLHWPARRSAKSSSAARARSDR